ncbi:uncharacterized protein PG998_004822 [Apiospora kogelbergensis]|uniref:Uncharacterized protein n=1 Tax=Apiospora kogelbergensis TaxID=1337665 RepID=A0AAW0QI73_9PEZI
MGTLCIQLLTVLRTGPEEDKEGLLGMRKQCESYNKLYTEKETWLADTTNSAWTVSPTHSDTANAAVAATASSIMKAQPQRCATGARHEIDMSDELTGLAKCKPI